jgi:mannose-6-phosphate isomerase class I
VEQALAVTNWSDYNVQPARPEVSLLDGNRKSTLVTSDYFTAVRYDLDHEFTLQLPGDRFHILNCVAGSGALASVEGAEMLHFGDSVLIPATLTELILQPNGNASFLISYVT